MGIVHYMIHPQNCKADEVICLQDLFSKSDQHGKGIVHALIEGLDKVADDNGTPTVY